MPRERKDYSVVTYGGNTYELQNNMQFVQKLRLRLEVRKQNTKKKTIEPIDYDKTMSSLIGHSKCTILIFTPSFGEQTWNKIFNQGEKTFDARTKAGRRLIPVIMPGFKGTALLHLLGSWKVLANEPVTFGTHWKKDEEAWDRLTDTIKALEYHYESGECINLVEFSADMKYMTLNRPPPGNPCTRTRKYKRTRTPTRTLTCLL